jgi:quercetin dioxygenase-like cupin family protein
MDKSAFETKLKADGFTVIEALKLGARPANHEHGHDHTVRGLVLAGAFTVICGGKPKTYRPGEIFEVAKGVEHSEEIGSEGAEVVVGRKF